MARPTDAAIAISVTTILLLLGGTTATRSAPGSIPLDCTGRRIHVRDLPPAFKLGLLFSCSDYAPFLEEFCHYLSEHGLGQPTRPGSVSWHRTVPLALELLFHRRLLSYPCLSRDPSLADAVFLLTTLPSLRCLTCTVLLLIRRPPTASTSLSSSLGISRRCGGGMMGTTTSSSLHGGTSIRTLKRISRSGVRLSSGYQSFVTSLR
ncbi:hypothetical protein MLD38_036542 [Melastoma candidum]|uniref:Uncharacterized protein n=1 Tax=Melastoma candidum TaxID=119954 RepID=A0ACB9LK26_9MYRT|nr:hypothetical protein MLD38_036542 [Melastoma candidum]